MGSKYISILLVVVLLSTGLSALVSCIAIGLEDDQNYSALTPDNDNSFYTATELFNRTKVSGDVDFSDDPYDYYKIELDLGRFNKGELLEVNLTITDPFAGATNVYFFNPEKFWIGNDVAFKPFGSPLFKYIFPCYDGYYYIRVTADPIFQQANYDLTVTYSDQVMPTDSDNTNATATLAGDDGEYSGFLHPIRDYLDLYNITLSSNQALELELFPKDDKYLAVYNPDGTLRKMSDLGDFDEGDKEIVKFAVNQTGTYRIAVGISGAPTSSPSYLLNTSIIEDVEPDNDYDEEHATRVYDGTLINTSFDSEYDEYDYYVMELNDTDNLTVSILYTPGPGDLDIDIYDEVNKDSINDEAHYDDNKGLWTWGIADADETDYFIEVINWDTSQPVDYQILFSLNEKNLWFKPMKKNNTNLDFSMNEDTIDESHVNLTHIFYDPDSPIEFGSPSHPTGTGTNLDIEILDNGTVKFMPHQNYFGYEIVNFSATAIDLVKMYWEVNVTVLNTNDPPKVKTSFSQMFYQGEIRFYEDSNYTDLDLDDVFWDPLDNDVVTFSYKGNENVYISIAGDGKVKFTTLANWSGEENINFTATDPKGANVSDVLTVKVEPLNDAPTFVSVGNKSAVPGGDIDLNATEDMWNNYTMNVSDVDHEVGIIDYLDFAELWYSSDSGHPNFIINTKTGNISFYPTQDDVGTFNVRIYVQDGRGAEAKQDLRINVLNVNDAPENPTINLDSFNRSTVNCSVQAVFDEDGDVLNYNWDFNDGTGPQNLGRFGNHTYSELGVYNITLTVTDGRGGVSQDIIQVNITSLTPDINDTNGGGGDGDGDGDGDVMDNDTKKFVDIDNDTLDDKWEEFFFGDKNLTVEPNDDYDEDGYTNYEEYIGKTDPTNPYDIPAKEPSEDKGAEDTKELESLMLIIGIVVIINFILVIIIIALMMMRKRPMRGGSEVEPRVPFQKGEPERFTIPCPECGRSVYEDELECPHCGEPLEEPGYKYDEEPRYRKGRREHGRGKETERDYYEDKEEFIDDRDVEDYEYDNEEFEDEYYDEGEFEDEEFEDEYEDEYIDDRDAEDYEYEDEEEYIDDRDAEDYEYEDDEFEDEYYEEDYEPDDEYYDYEEYDEDEEYYKD